MDTLMLGRQEHNKDFKMKSTHKNYCVIKFLDLPYKNINPYVCVPWSWIISRRKIDQTVLVSYPIENPSETEYRVRKRQKCSETWMLYQSVVEYSTDLYEDAVYNCSSMKKRDQESSAPVETKTRSPRPKLRATYEIDKPPDLIVTPKRDDKSTTKNSKRIAEPSPDPEVALKRSKVVKPTESVSEAIDQPNPAIECLIENQTPPTRKDYPIQNSCTSEISVGESDNRSSTEGTDQAENITTKLPSVIQNPSNSKNCSSSSKLILDTATVPEFLSILRNLHNVCANSYTLVANLRRTLIVNNETLKNVQQFIMNSRSSSNNIPTTSLLSNATKEVEKISEDNQRKQKQQDEEYDDHGGDRNDAVAQKKRSHKRKFVLPPEYDKYDSRWTLKHRESAPELVELMPHTNVYINAIKLSNCKRLSKDCKSFARMLLVEIFTKNALSVCSLTGTRARAYDVEGAVIRPGLDENARTVLLTYVEEYGRQKGWITVETQSILNSLRNKMQEFRFKYG